ncbi:hypothetical protein D3C87_829370 [compost metagenome]
MYNYHRWPCQIGMEDGGGSIHCNRYESPRQEKPVQLRFHETHQCWVTGEEGALYLTFGDMPEPMVEVGNTAVIKIRDYVIECKKLPGSVYSISSIKSKDGAVFNTLQLAHRDPLVKMLRATVYVPITDLYK